MSVTLLIAGALAWILALLAPAIFSAGLIAAGAVMVSAAFIIVAIESMHTTLALGSTKRFQMNVRTQRQCPVCKEIVRIDALRCRFCTSQITPPKPVVDTEPTPQFDRVPAPRQVDPKQI
jgi:hypothetical protein